MFVLGGKLLQEAVLQIRNRLRTRAGLSLNLLGCVHPGSRGAASLWRLHNRLSKVALGSLLSLGDFHFKQKASPYLNGMYLV